MAKEFYVKWENEYSEIFIGKMPVGKEFSGPFKSLSDAKKTLIPFLETKISDTRDNLQKIRALRPEDFEDVPNDLDDL